MFTTNLSQANCRKVFIQRDFSEGSWVRFATRFPVELEGKMDRQLSDYTNIKPNHWYAGVEKGSCSTYCEGYMDFLTVKMCLSIQLDIPWQSRLLFSKHNDYLLNVTVGPHLELVAVKAAVEVVHLCRYLHNHPTQQIVRRGGEGLHLLRGLHGLPHCQDGPAAD